MTAMDQIVSVTLLDRTYTFKCSSEKKDQLLASANYVENEMQKIKQSMPMSSCDALLEK